MTPTAPLKAPMPYYGGRKNEPHMVQLSHNITSLYGVGRTLEALPTTPCNRGARAMDTLEPTIEYCEIPGFPGYRVGSDGSVWSRQNSRHGLRTTWRRMTFTPAHDGYYLAHLYQQKKRTARKVHVLVLECFVSPRPPGMFGLHKNDNRTDNRLENLYWGTAAQNGRDAIRNKRALVGKAHPFCKISEDMVHLIRQRVARGEPHYVIAADLHISRQAVGYIGRGKHRRHVTTVIGEETQIADEQIARPSNRKPRYKPSEKRK